MAKARHIGTVDRSRAQQSVFKRTVLSSTIPRKLYSPDGKYFGDVSYDAYKAVEGYTLDSYTPISKEEKQILDSFISHRGWTLQTEDGVTYGNLRYNTYKSLMNDSINGIYDLPVFVLPHAVHTHPLIPFIHPVVRFLNLNGCLQVSLLS